MKRFFSLMALALLTSAAAAPFTLTPGQTARAGAFSITLLRVQDVRCPPRAYCLLAGNVTAKVLVTRGKRTRLVTLSLFDGPAMTPAGTLALRKVNRGAGRPVLTFDLTRSPVTQ